MFRSALSQKCAGFALCYFKSYTIPNGRTLYMEDLYVRAAHRSHGLGRQLVEHVQQFGRANGCYQLEFQVMRWNPAVAFYERLGAVDMTASRGWHQFRVHGDALRALAN